MFLLVLISESQDTIFSESMNLTSILQSISGAFQILLQRSAGCQFQMKIHHIYILTFKQSADNLIFKSPGI